MSWDGKILIYSILIFGLSATTSLAQVIPHASYRLKRDVIPDLYDITIKPYLLPEDGEKQFTFEGEVNITLHTVENNTVLITLHKDYMDILEGILYDSNGNNIQQIPKNEFDYVPELDKLSFYLWKTMEVNTNYTLYLKYIGQIRSGLAGVFRATYDDTNWYGITQLQRIDARTAFPCFDEPAFKAKFRMHISRPKHYSSFFNTRLISTTSDGVDRYLDHFEETPVMSTYLVAFLISDFETHGDTDFKLIMHSKFNNKTNFAYEVGVKTLEAYDKYTQIPYKTLGNTIMQKAGSKRFPHNGMENWGLVIYHDSVLSHEPGYTDGWSDKEYTITILVHETAHMWFGNSVTFKWWSYFWLNEAFARYYQYFLAHEIYPEYELDKQFVINQVHLIFGTDATGSSQPMTSYEGSINSPSEIGYKFSSIAYAKGASIVRMIRNLMGKENFDSAIRDYLRENHLKNTIPDDLFKHLKNYWPTDQYLDLDQFFTDWTEHVGYPMLKVSTTSSGEYLLKQQRFLLDPYDGDGSQTYTIPITYTTNQERNFEDLTPKFYFNETLSEVTFGQANEDGWIIFNIQQSNYHRVFYDTLLLKKLRNAFMSANHSDIHVINRANVVDDLFTYGRAGLMGYDEIFDFMEYLANEEEYLPWYAAFKGINTVHERLVMEKHKDFGDLLFELLDKVYTKLKFESSNDTVLDVYNRNKVINWLCKYHHSDCNTQAIEIFNSHLKNNTKPLPDFRETLYCSACRDDKLDVYGNLLQMFKSESLIVEKEKLLRAMGCSIHFSDAHYKFILTNEVPADLKTIGIRSMYTQTSENIMPVFHMVTSDVEHLTEILGSWSSTASVISDVTNYFTTQEQLDELNQFIAEKGSLFGASISTLRNAVRTVEKNLNWSATHLEKFFDYLELRKENSATSIKSALMVVPILAIIFFKFVM